MFNETAFSWALVNMWLADRKDFIGITRGHVWYAARFNGKTKWDPDLSFWGPTILDALKLAQKELSGGGT